MKKIWVNIGIFFGCFLLLITCLGAVLIMAPGMELLGIMYIRSTSGSVEAKQSVADISTFENIYIETNNIPIQVEFIQSYTLRVKMVEEYDGFAKAGGTPNFKISQEGDTIAINSFEYVPFLAHSRSKESGLVVQIPMYYNHNISVVSKNSPLEFCGQGAEVNDIIVNTGGDVQFTNDLKMHSLNIALKNNDAKISDSVVMDGHIIATSKHGNLRIPVGFQGNIEFSSTTGDLEIGHCANVVFNSKTGAFKGIGETLPTIASDATIKTNGKIEIESIGGVGIINAGNSSVTIGKKDCVFDSKIEVNSKLGKINLLGKFTNEENKIKSKYGKITAETISNMTIETTYGDINVSSVDGSATIITRNGDVNITSIYGKADITTKNGEVILGGADNVIDSANITTKNGDIKIINAGNGEINIETKNGDTEFNQHTSYKAKLTVKANKSNMTLNGLTGETNVQTIGKITAYIHDLNEPINLKGKNKRVEVHVSKTCYVDLESKKVIESAPDMTEEVKKYRNAPETETKQLLTIKTNRGKIAVIVD